MDEGRAGPLWTPGTGDAHLSQHGANMSYPLLPPAGQSLAHPLSPEKGFS